MVGGNDCLWKAKKGNKTAGVLRERKECGSRSMVIVAVTVAERAGRTLCGVFVGHPHQCLWEVMAGNGERITKDNLYYAVVCVMSLAVWCAEIAITRATLEG